MYSYTWSDGGTTWPSGRRDSVPNERTARAPRRGRRAAQVGARRGRRAPDGAAHSRLSSASPRRAATDARAHAPLGPPRRGRPTIRERDGARLYADLHQHALVAYLGLRDEAAGRTWPPGAAAARPRGRPRQRCSELSQLVGTTPQVPGSARAPAAGDLGTRRACPPDQRADHRARVPRVRHGAQPLGTPRRSDHKPPR
jgi:hypothetical protein